MRQTSSSGDCGSSSSLATPVLTLDLDLNRVLGMATALYGVGIALRPRWLAAPCGLPMRADGSVPPATRVLVAALGARDAAIGAAMVAARDARSRRLVTACRIASDLSDALVFGTMPAGDRASRTKAAAIALSWGALCAWSLRTPPTAVATAGGGITDGTGTAVRRCR
ncbi:hypothetical protein ABZZ20_30160 [Streptomyces sp. NPDC006430]|uniref:hypothetical protein n=1 Tax=Streptomyces sp. NPDC006430 TaxID=3154299 RepID=UPI0033B6C753